VQTGGDVIESGPCRMSGAQPVDDVVDVGVLGGHDDFHVLR